MTKIIAISDIHGNLPELEPADILLISGDISPSFSKLSEQKDFILSSFSYWLRSLDIKYKIICAGNHDFIFQDNKSFRYELKDCIYLEDESVNIKDINIYGTPWQPWHWDYAFNSPDKNSEDFLNEKFSLIPENTDIIISHSPPSNLCNIGSTSLWEHCKRVKPKLHVYGHFHPVEKESESKVTWGNGEKTVFINASIVNHARKLVYPYRIYYYEDGKITY